MIARRICMWGSKCLLLCGCGCGALANGNCCCCCWPVNVIVGSMKQANIMGYFYQWAKWAYAKDLRAVDNTLVQPICATHTHTHNMRCCCCCQEMLLRLWQWQLRKLSPGPICFLLFLCWHFDASPRDMWAKSKCGTSLHSFVRVSALPFVRLVFGHTMKCSSLKDIA